MVSIFKSRISSIDCLANGKSPYYHWQSPRASQCWFVPLKPCRFEDNFNATKAISNLWTMLIFLHSTANESWSTPTAAPAALHSDSNCLRSAWKEGKKKTPHYSHWMSNFQPSSSASVGDMWLYALHDKYFPASERLKVIDNVLVVWLPSLDVCKTKQIKFHFYSISILLLFFFQPHRSEQTFHRNQKGRKLKNARKGRIWRKRKTIPSAYNKSNFALDMLLRIHTHDFVVYQSISFFRSFFFSFFEMGFLFILSTCEHGNMVPKGGWRRTGKRVRERESRAIHILRKAQFP